MPIVVSPALSASERRQWRWLLMLIVPVVLMSCSSPGLTKLGSREPETITITKKIAASVLIEPRSQVPVVRAQSIRVSPNSVVADPNETVQLSAAAFDSQGQLLKDVDFVWFIADPRAGRVTGDGLFLAGSVAGVYNNAVSVTSFQNTPLGIASVGSSVTVTIVGEAPTASLASVTIIPERPTVLARQIYRLSAVGFDENGLVIPGVRFVWRVNTPDMGRVNEIGYLTVEGGIGTSAGAVSVTGIWEGARVSASADLNVIAAANADDYLDVQILPSRFFIGRGEQLRLRAVALNGLGELITGTELRWSVEDPRAGTINARGGFVAGDTPGVYAESVKVEAVIPGERGFVRAVDFASVVVRTEEKLSRLTHVTTIPSSVTLIRGARMVLAAQPRDKSGRPLANVDVRWGATRLDVGEGRQRPL